MKRTIYILALLLTAITVTSCHDWLTERAPGKTGVDDFFTSAAAAKQAVNAAYTPLMWEYSNTYCPEWFIGDVCSDDSIKGGENLQDMGALYDMCNFRTTANNEALLDMYRFWFQGVFRANLAMEKISEMELDDTLDQRLKDRLIAEAYYLRAYYYFRLVRIFGGVPRIEAPIYSSDEWKQPRATVESIYELILSDLRTAEKSLWNRSEYPRDELGRATKGAAQAMLLKVNLYAGKYNDARTWGETFMNEQASEYSLCLNYMDNFYADRENCEESVFEIQYMAEGTSDYGGGIPNGGAGATRGTFTPILTRPRSSSILLVNEKGDKSSVGWGFNKPSADLYLEFEEGDPRREYTIVVPTNDQIEVEAQEVHYGNRNISRKYLYETSDGYFPKFAHDTRCPLNYKQIRLADVKLLYAEACIRTGDYGEARRQINDIRRRVMLPDTEAGDGDLEAALRHERRVELAMEGHRWFDLVRWGIAATTMNDYRTRYSGDVDTKTTVVSDDGEILKMDSHEGNDMGVFDGSKHVIFPIPWEELLLGELEQNPGYEQ